jgi:hypothetical protein
VGGSLADPVLQARKQSLLSRAFAGVTLRKLVLLALLVFVNGLYLELDNVGERIHDGQFLSWLAETGTDSLFHIVSVVVALLPVVVVGNLGPQQGWRRYAALAATVLLLAAPLGAVLRFVWVLLTFGGPDILKSYVGLSTRFYTRYAEWIGGVVAISEFYRRAMQSVDAMHQAELDRVALEEQMAEARMQVLQAQIEPHFLFNTLASVRRLYQIDRDRGRAMLENLMRYFETALPRMREGNSTLAREASLIEAYLNLQKIRMADRLAFEIDVPESLREAAVPPMMLLTLVENAIKHGIAPLPEGGSVSVSARRNRANLELDVIDTGRGFQSAGGAGTGLANTRARLASLFGRAASLALSPNAPRGIRARITLPQESAS